MWCRFIFRVSLFFRFECGGSDGVTGFDTLSPASLVPGYLPPSRIGIKFGDPVEVGDLVFAARGMGRGMLDGVRSEITDRLRQGVLELGREKDCVELNRTN